MADRVKCSKIPFTSRRNPGCRGADHDPRCEVYKAALVEWADRLPPPKKNPGGHGRSRKERGLPPQTKEQQIEQNKLNARNAGRPPSPYAGFPLDAIRALKSAKLGLKKDIRGSEIEKEAEEVAGYALERIAMVCGGKVSSRKAPSALKGAIQLRAELCEPIETVQNLKGTFDLAAAVAKANEKAKG